MGGGREGETDRQTDRQSTAEELKAERTAQCKRLQAHVRLVWQRHDR